METATPTAAIKPPTWFWIVSVLGLLWMLMGVLSWVMDLMMDEAALSQMSEAQQQLYRSRPQWIFIVYAIAIFSGLAGAIGLLMRKGWAVTALIISLIAVVVQFGYTLFVMDAVRVLGPALALPFPLMILVFGALLLWFAMHARKRGWITP